MKSNDRLAGAPSSGVPATAKLSTIEIEVEGKIYAHLSRQAKEQLQAKMAEHVAMVLKETESLEAADRAPGADPDIGRWHIEQSWWNILRRRSRRARHPTWDIILRSLYSLCLMAVGAGIEPDQAILKIADCANSYSPHAR